MATIIVGLCITVTRTVSFGCTDELAQEEEGVFEDEDLADPDEYELAPDGLIDVAGALGADGAVYSDTDPGL